MLAFSRSISIRGGGDIHRTHAESGDAYDGNNGQQEGQNQPLVLAQNQQIVVEVGLARRQINVGKRAASSKSLQPLPLFRAPCGIILFRRSSSTLTDRPTGKWPRQCRWQSQFQRSDQHFLGPAIRNVENVARVHGAYLPIRRSRTFFKSTSVSVCLPCRLCE